MKPGRKKSYEPNVIYKNYIVYRGSNPMRDAEVFEAHGLKFQKNVVYEVSEEVMEYLKAQKYFTFLKGMSNKVVDFK